MNTISLSFLDLSLAAALVLLLAILSFSLKLNQHRQLLTAAARAIVQLLLIGLILKSVFSHTHWYWVLLLISIMILLAGREVTARQKRPFAGWSGYGLGLSAMFISSTSVLVFSLLVMIQPTPWYEPQYAIPLMGMLLGNSMTGIALALDRLTETAWRERASIEAQLMLGISPRAAILGIEREAIRSGLMPIINAMSAAGIVSLPGMMTGQILAGSPPVEAVKYQILILLLIAVAAGTGSIIAVSVGARRLFDKRARLCLHRLKQPHQ
ncbi:MAG: ABC transporter permease [bacterium]